MICLLADWTWESVCNNGWGVDVVDCLWKAIENTTYVWLIHLFLDGVWIPGTLEIIVIF